MAGARRVNDRGETRLKIALYAIGGILAIIVFVAPLAWSLLRSFEPNEVIIGEQQGVRFTLANFAGLADAHLLRAVGNSLIVALATAALAAVLATLAGYGFARFRFRGANVLFGLVVLTMMVPFQAILTPLYLELNVLRLTDSLLGLVLFYTTVNLPFGVFVMRNTFLHVPQELEDSAHIDGTGLVRLIVSVLRPLVTPGVATVALYAFLASWTEFLGALTFLTKSRLYTLPVALVNLQSGAYGEINFGYLVAGAVVAMIPCIVLYAALQRFYVSGLSSGAVKG